MSEKNATRYRPLLDEEDQSSSRTSNSFDLLPPSRSRVRCLEGDTFSQILRLCNYILPFVSGLLLTLAVLEKKETLRLQALSSCTDNKTPVRFKGAFNIKTSFKGPPSPEVDAVWSNFTMIGPMDVSEDEFSSLNASIYAVRTPESMGGGYLGLYDWMHQLHCVQELWEHTWPEYYTQEYEKTQNDLDWWHSHADHCADLLRQKILCDLDDNIMTYNWVKGHAAPKPNYNTVHMCRNLDDAYELAITREIKTGSDERTYFTRPEGVEVVEFDDVPYDPKAADSLGNLELEGP